MACSIFKLIFKIASVQLPTCSGAERIYVVLQPQLKVKPVGLKAWMLEVCSLVLGLPYAL